MTDKYKDCKRCGGTYGIHHYETLQCPVNGVEAPIGRKQEWMTCTFEVDSTELEETISRMSKNTVRLEAENARLSEATAEYHKLTERQRERIAELEEALRGCLDVLENMTTREFSLGKDKPQREAARAALEKG